MLSIISLLYLSNKFQFLNIYKYIYKNNIYIKKGGRKKKETGNSMFFLMTEER